MSANRRPIQTNFGRPPGMCQPLKEGRPYELALDVISISSAIKDESDNRIRLKKYLLPIPAESVTLPFSAAPDVNIAILQY